MRRYGFDSYPVLNDLAMAGGSLIVAPASLDILGRIRQLEQKGERERVPHGHHPRVAIQESRHLLRK